MQQDEQIYDRLNTLERDVARIGPQLENINDILGDLVKRVHQPTNFIGVGGLLVVVFGAMIAFVQLNMSPLETTLTTLTNVTSKNSDAVLLLRSDTSSTRLEERVVNLKEDVTDLDVVLQREMRLLDDILQREIALNREIIEGQIDALGSRVDGVFSRVDDIDDYGSRVWGAVRNAP